MTLLLLFWEFFKTGLFAVGGGMATIPFLTQMAQAHPDWFTLNMLADMIAVSESTPGPIGVNMATYVGYTVSGIPGALVATSALVLPSYLIIVIIARAYERYRSNRLVDAGFRALRPAVTGLIAAAGYAVMQIALFGGQGANPSALSLFALLFVLMQTKKLSKIHPIAYIAVSALAGIALGMGTP